jgi:hypothetical protein
MSITLESIRIHNEIYITIEVNTNLFYEILGEKSNNNWDEVMEVIISCHKQRTNILARGFLPYLKDTICDFKVTHINKDDSELIFLHTNVKEKIENFLNKLNTIPYEIKDKVY